MYKFQLSSGWLAFRARAIYAFFALKTYLNGQKMHSLEAPLREAVLCSVYTCTMHELVLKRC